jgi:hypothetical protein
MSNEQFCLLMGVPIMSYLILMFIILWVHVNGRLSDLRSLVNYRIDSVDSARLRSDKDSSLDRLRAHKDAREERLRTDARIRAIEARLDALEKKP